MKKRYWLRGGVTLVVIYLAIIFIYPDLWFYFLSQPVIHISVILGGSNSDGYPVMLLVGLLGVLFYWILGSILGWVYGKIKNKIN